MTKTVSFAISSWCTEISCRFMMVGWLSQNQFWLHLQQLCVIQRNELLTIFLMFTDLQHNIYLSRRYQWQTEAGELIQTQHNTKKSLIELRMEWWNHGCDKVYVSKCSQSCSLQWTVILQSVCWGIKVWCFITATSLTQTGEVYDGKGIWWERHKGELWSRRSEWSHTEEALDSNTSYAAMHLTQWGLHCFTCKPTSSIYYSTLITYQQFYSWY